MGNPSGVSHKHNLTGVFRRRVAIGVLVGAAVLGGTSSGPSIPRMPENVRAMLTQKTCRPMSVIKEGRGVIEHYLGDVFRRAQVPLDQPDLLNDTPFVVCFDPGMLPAGLLGLYEPNTDVLLLPVGGDEAGTVTTIRHEMRHRQHAVDRVVPDDVAERLTLGDRINIHVAEEMDARVEEIAMAYDLQEQGQPEYVESQLRDDGNTLAMKAYIQSMTERPGDRPAAMAAAFKMLYEDKVLLSIYVQEALQHEPDVEDGQPESLAVPSDLLAPILMRLGERKGMASYINQRLSGSVSKIYRLKPPKVEPALRPGV